MTPFGVSHPILQVRHLDPSFGGYLLPLELDLLNHRLVLGNLAVRLDHRTVMSDSRKVSE